MLLSGKLMGELARALKLPAVVGEIMAGILLGPTVLGMVAPDIFQNIFPQVGNSAIALDGMVKIAVILLLFIAGLEVELHIVWQRGREAVFISLLGIIVPFAIGFATVWFFPDFFQVADQQSKII